MPSVIHQHTLSNGLKLVAEPIASMRSVAMSLLLPAGAAQEPADRQGIGAMLSEMLLRGAGGQSAKQHTDALDALGVERDASAQSRHFRISAVMVGSQLARAFPLLIDLVRRPGLEESSLEPSRDLALQGIEALQDDPQHKTFVRLAELHYPAPLGRSILGNPAHLRAIALDDVRTHWRRTFVPGGAILGVAGSFDWPSLKDQVERLLGDWEGRRAEPVVTAPARRGYEHQTADTQQVHIGLAYDSVPEVDPRSVPARLAVAVLSGGSSSRLFTEVREKRALCYAVGARYSADRDIGSVVCYCGTTAPRAQETLDVLAGELHRLSRGAARDEFDRALVGMRSTLVMQGESTSARAAAIAADQYLYSRPRTLEEVEAEVQSVTLDTLNDYLAAHPPGRMTITTVGPGPLQVPA